MHTQAPVTSKIAVAALVAVFAAAGGCAQSPGFSRDQVAQMQQQQLALTQQNQELRGRAASLDGDNQQLETLLAQSQQRASILDDEVTALREQLSTTSRELVATREQRQAVSDKAQAMAASMRKHVGAAINANSSLRGALPDLHIQGVDVRQDGEVVRIEVAGQRVFSPGSARLSPDAGPILEEIAAEISRNYPGHYVGIEGHTDSDPIHNSQWATNHQLSVGRATAIYEYLTARTRLTADQLMIVGHGPNHPVVSNATTAGKERNRRVELVVYPERVSQR